MASSLKRFLSSEADCHVSDLTGLDDNSRSTHPAEPRLIQDTIVRSVLAAKGMSLNEYVVSCAVSSATNDLADRRVFCLDPEQWEDLEDIFDRPAVSKPKIASLLDTPAALEQG